MSKTNPSCVVFGILVIACSSVTGGFAAVPQDAAKEIRQLVQQEKYAEAVAKVDALLKASPDDPHLAALRQQITDAAKDAGKPVKPAAATGPDATADRIDLAALQAILTDYRAVSDPGAKRKLMEDYLRESDGVAHRRLDRKDLWIQRALAALEADQASAGAEAAQQLHALNVAEDGDDAALALLGRLKLRGWYDQARFLASDAQARRGEELVKAGDFAGADEAFAQACETYGPNARAAGARASIASQVPASRAAAAEAVRHRLEKFLAEDANAVDAAAQDFGAIFEAANKDWRIRDIKSTRDKDFPDEKRWLELPSFPGGFIFQSKRKAESGYVNVELPFAKVRSTEFAKEREPALVRRILSKFASKWRVEEFATPFYCIHFKGHSLMVKVRLQDQDGESRWMITLGSSED